MRFGMNGSYSNATDVFSLGMSISDSYTFPLDESAFSAGLGSHLELNFGLATAQVSFSALAGLAVSYELAEKMTLSWLVGPAFGLYESGIGNNTEILLGGGADIYYTLFLDKAKTVGFDLGLSALIGASLGDKARGQCLLYQVSATASIRINSDNFWFLFPWYWWMFFDLLLDN